MPLEQLQSLMARQGEATFFAVSAARHEREPVERLARQIEALAPGLQALRAREYVDTSIEVRMAKAVAWLTSAIALIIGMIGMVNTMATAVFERTSELAILRAVGWRNRTVMRLILSESIILGAAGAALGHGRGLGADAALSRLSASQRFVSGEIGLDGRAARSVAGAAAQRARRTSTRPTERPKPTRPRVSGTSKSGGIHSARPTVFKRDPVPCRSRRSPSQWLPHRAHQGRSQLRSARLRCRLLGPR